MTHTAALYDDGPIALRYPRGEGLGLCGEQFLGAERRHVEQLVERLAFGDALLELRCLRLQLGVGEFLHLRLERIDLDDGSLQLTQQAIVAAAENAGKQAVEHVQIRKGGPCKANGDCAGGTQ